MTNTTDTATTATGLSAPPPTVEEALANAVPVPTISASIFARFVSRQDDSPAMKAVAALRQQFGGHAVRKS